METQEFGPDVSGQSGMTVVKQESEGKYNAKLNNTDVEEIANFINANAKNGEAKNYSVPFSYQLAAPLLPPLFWKEDHWYQLYQSIGMAPHLQVSKSSTATLSDMYSHVITLMVIMAEKPILFSPIANQHLLVL